MKPTKKRNRPKPRDVRRRAYAASQRVAPEQPRAWDDEPTLEELNRVVAALIAAIDRRPRTIATLAAQTLFSLNNPELRYVAAGFGVACLDANRLYEDGHNWEEDTNW